MSETWVCHECAKQCDPEKPSEWEVIKSGYKTFAIHTACRDSYESCPNPHHVPLPPK